MSDQQSDTNIFEYKKTWRESLGRIQYLSDVVCCICVWSEGAEIIQECKKVYPHRKQVLSSCQKVKTLKLFLFGHVLLRY